MKIFKATTDSLSGLTERLGYKYIIGAKTKTESKEMQRRILSEPKENGVMQEIIREDRRRLLVVTPSIGYVNDNRNY
jgi:hypothetical protein